MTEKPITIYQIDALQIFILNPGNYQEQQKMIPGDIKRQNP